MFGNRGLTRLCRVLLQNYSKENSEDQMKIVYFLFHYLSSRLWTIWCTCCVLSMIELLLTFKSKEENFTFVIRI